MRSERSDGAPDSTRTLTISFPRSVESAQVISFWSGVAAALTIGHRFGFRPWLIAEVLSEPGHIQFAVHAPDSVATVVQQQFSSQLPAVRWTKGEQAALAMDEAVELRLTVSQRSLRTDRAAEVSTAVLMALAAVGPMESAVLQWTLAGTAPAPATHGTSSDRQWPLAASDVRVERGPIGPEMRSKAFEPLLVGVCRIGVSASSQGRRRLLLRGVLGALRGSDAPGVRTLVRVLPGRCHRLRLERRTVPKVWHTLYNGAELAARVPFPIDGPQVPGVSLGGSRLLVPSRAISADPSEGVVLAAATFPGLDQPIVIRDRDRLEHLYLNGPTGVGKSTCLARIATQDAAHGHALIVIEPRGDLIDDIIDRLPEHRISDVIVLDPADEARPVGYNPLAAVGRSLDLVSDSVTSVFSGLFAQFWGPRTDDVLRSCLMTLGLADRPASEVFTLCEIPVLLTDKGFRKPLTSALSDPIALEPFWAVYEGMRPAERAQVISPLLNKLRAFLLRQSLRTMLGQSEPKWSIEQVMRERKILLVPLRAGLIGEEAAQLFGSLVVSRIWQATLGRSALAREDRTPVMVIIDEFHTLVHSEASLGDLLAQARGHGVGLTLAHQHLGQLSPEMRRDVLANARSKVLFQQGVEDARILARGLPELEPEDLQGLPSREVVISLVTNAEVQPAVTGRTLPLDPPTGTAAAAHDHSRTTYGIDRAEVEAALLDRLGRAPTTATTTESSAPAPRKRPAPKSRPTMRIGDVPEEDES